METRYQPVCHSETLNDLRFPFRAQVYKSPESSGHKELDLFGLLVLHT